MEQNKSDKKYQSIEKINAEQVQSLDSKIYRHYLEVINEFAIGLLDRYSEHDIVWFIAKNAMGKLGFVDCVVYLVDKSKNCLIQKAAHGIKSPDYTEIVAPIEIPIGKGIVGTVAATGAIELINDVTKDKRYILDVVQNGSELAVPIMMNGEVLGVIDSEHHDKNFFTVEHVKIMRTIASMTATKLAQARAVKKLEQHQEELENIVTDRTRNLQDTLKKLEHSNKAFKNFSYIVSHDLREPLRTIASYLQLLEMTSTTNELSEESIEYLNRAVDGAKRMDSLIQGILEYSKLDKDKGDVVDVDIKEIIQIIEKNLSLKIDETNTNINCTRDLPIVRGKKSLLLVLFQNLVDNAIKFRSDKPPIINISYIEQANYWEFNVQDNGIGIKNDPKVREYIFNIFHRLYPKENKYTGSGLGLALCKNIVEQHNGTIKVESIEHEGSSFIFTLRK